jgi:hypothetical protein
MFENFLVPKDILAGFEIIPSNDSSLKFELRR